MFAWDIRKAISNYEKHGVPFEEAATVFGDSSGLDGEDFVHSHRDHRFKRIGRSITGRILFVVYMTRRTDDGKETIRITSARQSEPQGASGILPTRRDLRTGSVKGGLKDCVIARPDPISGPHICVLTPYLCPRYQLCHQLNNQRGLRKQLQMLLHSSVYFTMPHDRAFASSARRWGCETRRLS